MTNIKSEVGFGRLDAAGQIAKKASWRFWFYLITRKIAPGVGKAVRDLNENYGTNMFNSQAMLWPGEENIGRVQKYMTNAKKDISSLMDYPDTNRYKWILGDRLALRAVKTMFHANKYRTRKIFQDSNAAAHRATIGRDIENAAAQKEIYSARLTGLRLYHELTILQIAGYKDLAGELAYSG